MALTPYELLEELIANDTEPILPAGTVEDLLERYAIADQSGYAPIEEDWTPTYDMNRAAAAGWRIKAGRVAADYNVTVEGRGLERHQMVTSFLDMAKAYARMAGVRTFEVGT
jgi:hypothetical protein